MVRDLPLTPARAPYVRATALPFIALVAGVTLTPAAARPVGAQGPVDVVGGIVRERATGVARAVV